jgi:hypothetical protein
VKPILAILCILVAIELCRRWFAAAPAAHWTGYEEWPSRELDLPWVFELDYPEILPQ